jgi:tRNA(fMet)-specific endonuclease VapC
MWWSSASTSEPETERCAACAACLVHRSGVKRGARDLIVVATAAATVRTIVTPDSGARFHELPYVDSVLIP